MQSPYEKVLNTLRDSGAFDHCNQQDKMVPLLRLVYREAETEKLKHSSERAVKTRESFIVNLQILRKNGSKRCQ
jgi:hypothetical protein